MNTPTMKNNTASLIGVSLLLAANAHAGYVANPSFADPDHWSVGSADSTYQEWDDLPNSTPDIGSSANPSISSSSTIAPVSPGFGTSSGNFYSFSGDYGFESTIYNHGGSSGSGSYGASMGTHVIIQTASSQNEGTGVYPSSIELYDPSNPGTTLTGGDNASAIGHSVIFQGVVSSSQGDVNYREDIWEFYLPGYTGDILIGGDIKIHASFDRFRVDTMITDSAFSPTAVPEPATYAAALGVITLGVVLRRRQRRR